MTFADPLARSRIAPNAALSYHQAMHVTVAEEAVLRMPDMSDDEFFDFCEANRDYRIERDSRGRVSIMPGTGGTTGARNSEITYQVQAFSRRIRTGTAFDSSTMFLLPGGAIRSPDAAWVSKQRLAGLSANQKDRFLPLAPDFLIELRSRSDSSAELQTKMSEWMEAGCTEGWLIDPPQRTVAVYRDGGCEILTNPERVSTGGAFPGFTLEMAEIWDPEI